MSNPTSAGSRPLAGDPIGHQRIQPGAYLFPAAGVPAPGPLGQIEVPNTLPRDWLAQIPPALEFGFFQLKASGSGQQNIVTVSRPTLCMVTDSSFPNPASERFYINFAPETQAGPGFAGYTSSRDTFLLPSPGTWIVTCQARNAAGVDIVDTAELVMIDATNPAMLRALLPHDTCQIVESPPDVTLAAATDALVLTLLQVTRCTGLLLVNTGAGVTRLSFGAVAGVSTGILLTASGTMGDRIHLPSNMVPMESLHARSTAGSTLSVTRFVG